MRTQIKTNHYNTYIKFKGLNPVFLDRGIRMNFELHTVFKEFIKPGTIFYCENRNNNLDKEYYFLNKATRAKYFKLYEALKK